MTLTQTYKLSQLSSLFKVIKCNELQFVFLFCFLDSLSFSCCCNFSVDSRDGAFYNNIAFLGNFYHLQWIQVTRTSCSLGAHNFAVQKFDTVVAGGMKYSIPAKRMKNSINIYVNLSSEGNLFK